MPPPSNLHSPASSAFRAGFGKSDITPRVGVQLAGFGPYLNRHSTGIHAPLYARAAALSSGSETCLLLALDLCGISRPLFRRIRSVVAEGIGDSGDHIMVACTHTHSGPSTVGHMGWGQPDDMYIETLPSRILRAAEAAIEDMGEVRVGSASPPCEGIAINRDYDSAYDRSLPIDHFLADSWRPAKPEKTDTKCDVITFHEGEQLKGFISSFGCHPVVCCEKNTLIHGDFVGLATSQVENQYPGSIGIFLPGALGDINPSISHRPADESIRALDVISTRYARSVETGVLSALPIAEASLSIATRHTRFPRVDWTREDLKERILALEGKLHAPDLSDNPLHGDNPLERTGMHMVRLAGLRKVLGRLDRGEDLNLPAELQGIGIGSIRLLGSPFEVFQQTKNEVRASAPEGLNIVLSLVNGAEGYVPDPIIYKRQGYTAEFVPLMKGDLPHMGLHDLLVAELTQLAVML